MQLDNELWIIELGSLSITEYLRKINRITDLLANIDSLVDEKNLFIYAINGLSDKEPSRQSARDSTSSSPHVLLATASNNRNNSAGIPLCRNFQRGSYNFVKRCKPTKMGYAPRPGNIPLIPQATSNWTIPTTYHSTATTFGSRGILGPAPRQAHVTQRTIPLGPTSPAGVSPYGPLAYTTGPLHGTWVSQVIISRHVTFEENVFPYDSTNPAQQNTYQFLDTLNNPSPIALCLLTTPNNTIQINPSHAPTSNEIPTPSTITLNEPITTYDTPTSTSTTTTQNQQIQLPSPQALDQPQASKQTNPTTQTHASLQTHPMVTRFKVGIVKKNPKFSCPVSISSSMSRSHIHALRDLNWQHAILDEYNALISNDGSLSWYKARLVVNGHSQPSMLVKYLSDAMMKCSPCKTPADTYFKLGPDGDPVPDPALYRSLVGSLQYLIFTRPDLSYANSRPQVTVIHLFDLLAYCILWCKLAGCPTTLRSTLDYCVFLGDNLITWSSKCQRVASCSSAEAEYRSIANAIAETAWFRNLLLQHQRMKHIEIDIHFVRNLVATVHVRVLHVSSRYQFADIFTKGLPSTFFAEFHSNLSVRPPPAPTTGAY
nr:hypothetical protein [Tanacetum cinerariifolium]